METDVIEERAGSTGRERTTRAEYHALSKGSGLLYDTDAHGLCLLGQRLVIRQMNGRYRVASRVLFLFTGRPSQSPKGLRRLNIIPSERSTGHRKGRPGSANLVLDREREKRLSIRG